MSGARALITGASSGLGKHFALTLADAGAHVTIAGRRLDALVAVAQDIESAGGTCQTLQLDVSNLPRDDTLDNHLRDLDILINNAGVTREASFLDQSEQDWDAVVDTNLKGMFLLTQATGRAMRTRGKGGSIVNVASILGLRQAAGIAPYAISKAAVLQLTKVAALELARYGIRVNALAPGYISTALNSDFWETDAGMAMIRRIPQRRLGQLADLNGPLLLLASKASSYMTGAVIEVDGGHLVSSL